MPQLTEQQIREIVRNELQTIIGIDRYNFQKHIKIFDGRVIQCGRNRGLVIGSEGYTDANDEGQKLGFYGKSDSDGFLGVIQPAKINDPSGGATVDSQARTAVNAIIDLLQSLGLMRSS